MITLRIEKHFADFHLQLGPCELAASGVTALFGPSGSGKTLTLDCIAGFANPDRGRIEIDGSLVFDKDTRISLPPQRRRCGYVFQNYALFPHMTLRENLRFANRDPRAVEEMLERFRLKQAANLRPHELSGGQKQRGSIARALLASPRILLLDEPSRGLDAELRAGFYDVLRQVRADFAMPMLLVSHDLDECFELADHMIVLRNGQVEQTGSPAQILARPATAAIARLLGCYNVFEAEVGSLSRERNWSLLRAGGEFLEATFIDGVAYGDRVTLAVRDAALRAWPRLRRDPLGINQVAATLERAVPMPAGRRLEFAGDLRVFESGAEAAALEGSEWVIEFPPDSLQVLRD